jgi:hypothetical protein
MAPKRTRTSASQRTEALERRVRELESQVCNLAIQVAAQAARGVPSVPYFPFPRQPYPVVWQPASPAWSDQITCGTQIS